MKYREMSAFGRIVFVCGIAEIALFAIYGFLAALFFMDKAGAADFMGSGDGALAMLGSDPSSAMAILLVAVAALDLICGIVSIAGAKNPSRLTGVFVISAILTAAGLFGAYLRFMNPGFVADVLYPQITAAIVLIAASFYKSKERGLGA